MTGGPTSSGSPAAALAERWPEIERAIVSGFVPAWARDAVHELLQRDIDAYASRVGGVAKAREKRSKAMDEACARHRGKVPITAPDLVERIAQSFARAGEVAPCDRFIRQWRSRQISNMQYNGIPST